MDLVLNTSQKMLLSQKMLQSTEILQMSSAELLEYLKEVSVENPVVDYEEKSDNEEKFNLIRKKLDYLDSSDEQNKTYYADDKEDESNNDDWKFKGNFGESLEEHLMEQVRVLSKSKNIRKACEYIVLSIDQNGYFKEGIEHIPKALKISETEAKEALSLVQALEPAGVGARDIKECLMLQLDRKGYKNIVAEQIIESCLERVGKNQVHLISKELKVCQNDVTTAIALIKTLNPKPGNSFDSKKTFEYIEPDAIIVKGEKGYEVILNDKFFTNISINPYYKTFLDETEDTKTKEYVYNRIKQAQWIMTCISKRNSTLMKTLETIVDIQKAFFDNGVGHMNPMCLNDIATTIEMHESTVSRTIKQKYLQCRHGIFPLSYFFQSNVLNQVDGLITPEKIKIMIKDIIYEENSSSPLSDREITEKLKDNDIDISRRTVAKYRESIGILGTSGRKT